MIYLLLRRALLAGLTAAALTAAIAQSPTDAPDITSPAAFVPAVRYRSVFVDTPKGVEMEELDWRRANADVGQFKRGHIDILKWEEEQAKRRTAPVPVMPHHPGAKP